MESYLGFYHHWDSTQKLANEFIFWISKQIQHAHTLERANIPMLIHPGIMLTVSFPVEEL